MSAMDLKLINTFEASNARLSFLKLFEVEQAKQHDKNKNAKKNFMITNIKGQFQ